MILRLYKSIYNILKSSFDTKGSVFVFEDGQAVTPQDVERLSDAFRLWTCMTFDEFETTSVLTFRRIFHTYTYIWKILALGYPLDNFFMSLKVITSWLRSEGSLTEIRDLARDDEIAVTLLCLYKSHIKNRREPSAFMHLHRMLVFLAKFHLEHDGLKDRGRLSWFDHETWLSTRSSAMVNSLTSDILPIISGWLENWDPSLFPAGYYTSGSTADAGKDLNRKISFRKVPLSLASLAVRECPQICHLAPLEVSRDYQFCSKWTQVPKNALSLREISMEPAALNWWQSAVDDHLRSVISSGPMRRYYTPENQSASRTLAVLGSRDGSLATIDLSKASDCVAMDHVLAWFPSNVTRWLLACRSPYARVADDIVPLNKYAPMGSRLTFDIESICFTALGVLALRRAGLPSRDQVLRVYGDDIVISSSAAPYLLDLLESTGFIPNKDKSYWTGHFREACGIFAYKGLDISGVALPRRKFEPLTRLSSASASWISEMANRAYYTNSGCLRYYLVATLLRYGTPKFHYPSIEEWCELFDGSSYPSRPPGAIDLASDSPTDWQMRSRPCRPLRIPKASSTRLGPRRLNPDYGHGESLRLVPRSRSDLVSDDDAYERWLYYASNRISSQSLRDCEQDCRKGEIHSLPPRDTWVVNPG